MERAKKFYKSVFGWQIKDYPEMNYTVATTTESDEMTGPKKPGAINGGMKKRMQKGEGPVIVMSVKSIDDTLKKVMANGGKNVGDKMTVADMGYYQLCMDCENNVVGLWQDAMKK